MARAKDEPDRTTDPAESDTTPDAHAPMTDGSTTVEPTTAAKPVTAADDLDLDDDQSPNAEAAKRRLQLREVEAERDALAGQLTSVRRQIVEGIIATATDIRGDGSNIRTLVRPADLFDVLRVDVGTLFDEQGNVDRAAIADALDARTRDRDYMLRDPGPVQPVGMTSEQAAADWFNSMIQSALGRSTSESSTANTTDADAGKRWQAAISGEATR